MLNKLRDFLRRLGAGADASVETRQLVNALLREQLRQALVSTHRYQDPLRLLSSGYKIYSQNEEDGMIAEVFRRIGHGSKRFIEFGVQDGLECNTALLLLQGWRGAWIEASEASAARARAHFQGYPVEIVADLVTVDNADALMARLSHGEELDLLSIDVDSVDYWIWDAIRSVRPRLVVIEYNAALPPPISLTMALPGRPWDGGNYMGASLTALERLGRTKGYCLVGCSLAGVNAFFVRDDLVGEAFLSPFTAENHYEPPRYALAGPSGHHPAMGPWTHIT
jgi:hypothetical protein